ncbi:hypothetical protein L3X38_024385 [Prunus dulcis]|uniref:Uncharacterized protein n=1 Tax=Prunus dulcis TaxID=3755 RepID=A0AAD4Z5E2_PRUDU|nr:hypothetical protein L3X38_024385 [Prunus dulcis]
MTYGITARVAFDNKCKDHVQEELITAVREVGLRPKLEKIHRKIDMILDNIVKEHKASKEEAENTGKDKANDLLGVLLDLQEHGELEVPLTMNNIKAVLLDIFTAWSETSSSTVEWAMSEMLKTPRVMRKAQAEVRQVFCTKGNVEENRLQELKFLKAVIKETLRIHPPIPLLLPKECSEKRFLDSSVDFRGTNFEFIPFRRICPRITFAIPNIELPVVQLLYHFDWKLPNGMKQEGLDMTETFGVTVRKKEELHLIPTPYHPEPNA